MDLNQLEAFRLSVQLGSFSLAAKQLFLTQAGVAARIRRLEEEIGIPLFQRDGRRLALTPAGESLLTFAREVQLLHEDFQHHLDPTSKAITIGASTSSAKYLLPRLFGEIAKTEPDHRYAVHNLAPDDIAGQIVSGQLDVGALAESRVPANAVHVRLYPMRLLLAGPPDAPDLIDPAHHSGKPFRFLTMESYRETSRIARAWAAEYRIPIEVVNTSVSQDALREGIRNGMGIALVADFAIAHDVRRGMVKLIDAPGLPQGFWMTLAALPARLDDPGIAALWNAAASPEWRRRVARVAIPPRVGLKDPSEHPAQLPA